MATAYPAALDTLTNPTATDAMNSATVPHATQHANLNDAMEAVQATLGSNPQGGFASVKARIQAVEEQGVVAIGTLGDGTVGATPEAVAESTNTFTTTQQRNIGVSITSRWSRGVATDSLFDITIELVDDSDAVVTVGSAAYTTGAVLAFDRGLSVVFEAIAAGTYTVRVKASDTGPSTTLVYLSGFIAL